MTSKAKKSLFVADLLGAKSMREAIGSITEDRVEVTEHPMLVVQDRTTPVNMLVVRSGFTPSNYHKFNQELIVEYANLNEEIETKSVCVDAVQGL